jgi:hypothetical protein
MATDTTTGMGRTLSKMGVSLADIAQYLMPHIEGYEGNLPSYLPQSVNQAGQSVRDFSEQQPANSREMMGQEAMAMAPLAFPAARMGKAVENFLDPYFGNVPRLTTIPRMTTVARMGRDASGKPMFTPEPTFVPERTFVPEVKSSIPKWAGQATNVGEAAASGAMAGRSNNQDDPWSAAVGGAAGAITHIPTQFGHFLFDQAGRIIGLIPPGLAGYFASKTRPHRQRQKDGSDQEAQR